MTEDAAYQAFLLIRWPATGGEPVCPACGCKRVYVGGRRGGKRRIFTCSNQNCRRQFTATSGTKFAHRKMSYAKIMLLMGSNFRSALAASRALGIEYRTAWAASKDGRCKIA